MNNMLNLLSIQLGITPFELKKIIDEILQTENYQEELLELLGFDNISCVEEICSNKEYFESVENIIEDKRLYGEILLPSCETVKVDEKDLISTDRCSNDKKYFSYLKFNPVQSAVFKCAYETDKNFLVCAPTGSGKTDIALLCILRALKKQSIVVYIVPMKALAYEISTKYQNTLKNYKVTEFTGDTEISSTKLRNSNLIICTPEKFDAYTRKLNNIFQDKLNLLIIDEIHILQENRGSVIETIVSRIFRYIELKQRHIRIIGLSATLPNYKDVSDFINASCYFNFDQRYRPVPLKTTIVGIYDNLKKKKVDSVFIEKLEELLINKKQVLVFVTSRSETLITAKLIIESEIVSGSFVNCKYPNNLKLNDNLKNILDFKIGIHHAGLPRNIRIFMENEFKNGKLDILVCTSTLAWGVNLPAHAVIIKGTEFFDSNIGIYKDLGVLDIFQIFGRAGRPQYKITGEAILITKFKKIGKYLNIIRNNTNIESKLLHHVSNIMNAEIYLNNITNLRDGLLWFKSTFMYIRMKKNPSHYGGFIEENTLLQDYVYLTITHLEEYGLISIYNKNEDFQLWTFRSTEYGRISSFYYLHYSTIQDWLIKIQDAEDEKNLILIILSSKDFENILYRSEEEYALKDLAEKMDLSIDYDKTVEFKLFVLLQAHLKRYQIALFSLKCDFLYVIKNFERCLEAFIEFLSCTKKFNLLRNSLFILQKLRKKSFKTDFKQKSPDIKILDCGKYFRIIIKNEYKKYWILLSSNTQIFEGTSVFRNYDNFIRKPDNFKDYHVLVEIYDIENNIFKEHKCLIKTCATVENILNEGYHVCSETITLLDIEKGCSHIKINNSRIDKLKMTHASTLLEKYKNNTFVISGLYAIDIDFNITTYYNYEEFIKQFVIISFNLLLSDNPVLLLCRNSSNCKVLGQEINTKLALYNIGNSKQLNKNIVYDGSKISSNCICIIPFTKACSVISSIYTIILTCRDSDKIYYPVYDILSVCNNRRVLLYENEEFIEYFREIVLKERA